MLITQYRTVLCHGVVLYFIYQASSTAISVLIPIEFAISFSANRLSYYVVSPILTLVAFTLTGRLWKHNSIFAIIVQTKELSNPNLSPKMRNCTAGWR